MINELSQLSATMQKANIANESWHRKYLSIPNITQKKPCIRIVVENTRVAMLESLTTDKGRQIRKYGDNQGSFPAMNLAPLYRINDETIREKIEKLLKGDGTDISEELVKSWCCVNNWSDKFKKKYKINFVDRPKQLEEQIQKADCFPPLQQLLKETEPFISPDVLHNALEEAAFQLIRDKTKLRLAAQVLFYLPSQKDVDKNDVNDSGNLSVVLDTFELEDQGFSTAGPRFTTGLNSALLQSEASSRLCQVISEKDAFGSNYSKIEEPMPKIKLAAGFDVALRTMFKGQPCQYRYGKIENETYPLSADNRSRFSAALAWIADDQHKGKTWVSIGKNEALYIFPSVISDSMPNMTDPFCRNQTEDTGIEQFEVKTTDFAEYISRTKRYDPDRYPEHIQFFVLRKLDKARTKVVYIYNATAEDVVIRSDRWHTAAGNLPHFHFGKPWTPFPLEVTGILNKVWKKDGTIVSDKYNEYPAYYGIKLFFGVPIPDRYNDLHTLVQNTINLAVYAGYQIRTRQKMNQTSFSQLKYMLSLTGMYLYWTDNRKDDYMNEYPYLFGQLLQVSDCLHELYCVIVRNNEIPAELAGGSLFISASEFPRQTLSQLAKRMAPYLNWAKTHQTAKLTGDEKTGEKSGPDAGYYLYIFRQIADKLQLAFTEQDRFSDAEKAQLFIGYLASFPKSKKTEDAEEANSGTTTEY